ncbi:hypothetical protein TNCV_3588551 [Trichonephila clavipes]|nr:hypothetical protein TNCV_3588551 [Trichonephila clavipes]
MKLANSTDTISVSSTDLEGQGVNRRVNLRDLVLKFDAKNADVNLFFEIFERQAKKEKVAEDRWVSQLIPLLPMEIAEIVTKEPLEKSDDYPHIKNLLLARFQLTPIALRDNLSRINADQGQYVEEFVKTCDSCQRVGKPRDKAKAPLKLVPIISEVFSKINIDAVGPLPASTEQNRYLITSICVASKYPEAIPVESITSPNVIDALLSIFSRIGFPREIQSDLGTSFTSELTTTFFNKFGIKVTRSSVSHPQSNAVERVHRTIKRVIKALCVESGEDWEGVLPLALFSLRTVAHESTGFSPTELVMGKNLRTPQTLVYEEWMEEGNTSQSVMEYILQLNNRLKRCQDIAITRMKECQLKRKTWYDRDAVERKFVEGDLVMVLATSKQNKLEVNWIGPGKIDELKQVITKNKDVFSPDPGTTHLMRMDIELISDKPIKTKPYRMSPRQINILREEIKRLLELGVIKIGQSDYTSPLILVESPNKDPRPCVDYRRLNEITRAEFFPLPNMEEIVEKVSAAPYVTVMDLSKGYFQIPLTPRAQRYAAFVTPFGTYIPKKMMFGLVCAPYYFCKLMAQVLEGLEQFALPYIDDIAIFSQGWKDHVKHIDIVLGRLRKAGLKVKPSKCWNNREKEKKELEKTRAGRFRKRRGESRSFLFRDADQESKTRIRKNALRTGPRQAVE